jgi:hypothetical protein
MRAVVLHEHGGPEKLIYESDYREPAIGAGDVLLRMRACALNYHDLFTRRGMPGITSPLPLILGRSQPSGPRSPASRPATGCWSIRSIGSPADFSATPWTAA